MQWDNTITAIFNWLGSLSWPAAVFFIFWVFRSPISKLLDRLKTLEWKGLKLGFGDIVKAISPDDNKLHDAIVQPLPAAAKKAKVLEARAFGLSGKEMEESKQRAQQRLDEDTKRVGYQRGKLYQLDSGQWAIAWEL